MNIEEQFKSLFTRLYGKNEASDCVKRLKNLFESYNFDFSLKKDERTGWTEKDAILITYADVITASDHSEKKGIELLEDFIDTYLNSSVSTVHLLPFFPSSSDQGFSVMDYKKVRAGLGDWEDIEHFSEKYRLMADLVINHASRYGEWFMNYEKGRNPGKDYFIEVEPDEDLTTVTRPRDSALKTAVETENGLRFVWTTFSDDQIDLDFTNPDVLFEFIDIFLFYISKGIEVIRLDAIAYLWKRVGSESIHLDETHQIVKLFRKIADCIDPEITIITETNVPFEENLSYFGQHDEAHMIYQFSLPPLLLHAILTEHARYLTRWAKSLPELPSHCTFFNFTASHDGIGVRPLEGLVPEKDVNYLVNGTKQRGGFVTYKQNGDGTQNPYELNITYFDAFEKPGHPRSELQKKRYLCSQVIMLSLKGVPGIYFHNLTSTKNYLDGVMETGDKRAINRKQWNYQELKDCISGKKEDSFCILDTYKKLLQKRKAHTAFHPDGTQEVVELKRHLFSFIRTSPDKKEQIFVIANVSSEKVEVNKTELTNAGVSTAETFDILDEEAVLQNGIVGFDSFQTRWLLLNKG